MSATRSMASAPPAQHAAQIPTTVHDPSVTPACVCIYGERALPAARLHALLAQLPSEAALLLCGASAELSSVEAMREPGVIGDDADAALLTARRLQPGRHIVLLRGDADLPPLAVARLLRAIAQTDALAVGALDNLDHARSPLPSSWPAEATPQRIDALCHAYARRAAFDTVSVSPLLSIWHGERLAQRATTQPFSHSAAGLRLLTLDHLYVGSDRDLRPLADVVADPRDPAPPSPLAELRIELAAALASRIHPDYDGLDARPVVLHILHGWGGGAERWVRDLASAWNTVHHLVLIARGSHRRRCHGEWLELHLGSLDGPPLRRVALAAPIADTAIAHAGYRQFLHEVIAGRGVDAIVVSSLIGHSLDAVRSGLPTLRVVHDHYPLWPVLHRDFGDPTLDFDDNQLDGDLAAQREFANTDPAHWKILRDATVASMLAAGTQLIAPSQSALRNELRLAPELAVLPQHVIGHGLAPWPHADAQLTEPPTRTRLRLVVPGRIRSGKGGDLLQRIIPALSDYADVFLLGAGSEGHLFFGQSGVHVLLDYDRDTLPELLAGIRADAALLVPTVAETFGYTLSELRDLGLPVIATRVGALAERIQDGEDGFLVDANAMAILQRIATLDGDTESLARVRQILMTRREPGLQAMASAYAALLALPTHALARTPLLHTGTMNMQLAAALTALERANAGQHSLQSQLVALNEESARRGDWGHALDRQLEKTRHELEERSRWALQLDDRNQRQEQQIQQLVAVANERAAMLASRSWRITAPLRTMTTGLRDLRTRLAFRSARLRAVLSRVRGSLRQHG
ncbi:MAG: glycosyltransferase family 4 protein, partial [Dokdonella sp.]